MRQLCIGYAGRTEVCPVFDSAEEARVIAAQIAELKTKDVAHVARFTAKDGAEFYVSCREVMYMFIV